MDFVYRNKTKFPIPIAATVREEKDGEVDVSVTTSFYNMILSDPHLSIVYNPNPRFASPFRLTLNRPF